MVNEIKKELRASMNGILSARMREAGMPFRLIYGVELPRLRSIADAFPADAALAAELWSQDIREARLLAMMLMPPEAFSAEEANAWADTMQTTEEAQVMAMLLLPKSSGAKELCLQWLEAGKPFPSVCACLCLRRLHVGGTEISEEERQHIEGHLLPRLLPGASLHLRKAVRALTEALGN